MTHLRKLLSIASPPLSETTPDLPVASSGSAPSELLGILRVCNGFSAFESALVVFPSMRAGGVPGVVEWNDGKGWRRYYRHALSLDYLCFAHDLFGVQFALSRTEVVRLNPESGSVVYYAGSLEDWAQRILEQYEEDTAWPLAHNWQLVHGVLPPKMRLLPKQPFILGGDYVVENLIPIECERAMEYWGRLYDGIHNVPDGQSISLSGWIA